MFHRGQLVFGQETPYMCELYVTRFCPQLNMGSFCPQFAIHKYAPYASLQFLHNCPFHCRVTYLEIL